MLYLNVFVNVSISINNLTNTYIHISEKKQVLICISSGECTYIHQNLGQQCTLNEH